MRVGVLTGGGDCPGLNAAIRAIVRKGEETYGDEMVGFRDGWRGAVEGSTTPLSVETCRGILPRGGTVLGTSRTNPNRIAAGIQKVRANLDRLGIDALVVIGGQNTLGIAHQLSRQGVVIVGVPKTIENDLAATEVSLGFQTAVQIATDAIDRLHTTAESHDRVLVCEVTGRHAGWIATCAGTAGGAAEILIPEERFDIDDVCENLRARHEKGRYASIVVVAEGATPRKDAASLQRSGDADPFGHPRLGGIGQFLAQEIEERTGLETRVTVLGRVLRGGTPTALDRVLATRFGIAAIDAVHGGASDHMVALRRGRVVCVPLESAVGRPRTVDRDLYHGVAGQFFG